MLDLVLISVLSYLCGSIPFGLIVSKLVGGFDIRKEGSGNIGATNVVRSLGKKWGVITFALDGLKGVLPLYVVKYQMDITSPEILGMVAIIAVLGHVFPVWLKFKGGKGVATAYMIFLFLNVYLGITYVLSWYFFYKTFRIVSLASIVSVISGLLYETLIGGDYTLTSFVIAIIIVFRHTSNIKRIFAGKEVSFQMDEKKN